MKSVYVINGFLESGKTEFITFTLGQPYFRIKGKTLLLVCEEGEKEYPADLLKQANVDLVVLEDVADTDPVKLTAIEKEHKPDRIIIEWNGMWNYKELKLPWYWKVEQQITMIDGSTFPMYYTNMKSLLAEQIRKSELIIFNRCDTCRDQLPTYRRNVRAVNPGAEVVFEDKDGEINEIFEEDLPYDLKATELTLDSNTYGIWYLDAMDHPERYVGKTLVFQAMAMTPPEFPEGYFIPGRMAMTCCAQDMAFLGYACKYDRAKELKDKEWVVVTAKVEKEYFPDYEGEGPVLHAVTVEKSREPKDAVINFT
ncbi:MAG: GTPase [Lachnospiraceae bacterium]|nr:GTPase [Lachnospiraceae bacterium]MCR5477160.1 GTPase [Lachnospiraceae bacterium]